ncbi:response regulator transcription factor [Pseudobacteriovorax antillogorgiicola]|uniref:DNA-binding response regulator, OmpR family, contains REC and winged-helix (WHTH) domain n=1 Tax=Pseudobacteriovorax antillogorgiicola TaxID=1513793 RepID=A0A1Y6CBJ3_9BACT|nr:response regulator [Pseudobacteriovorax antillogorgiicola]TCS49405.1 DNA-binding response OmpR family regulator [Pseudobacteriovorax antillogorgiicola]SMF47014.1 DNA-binding response regulator, OmpR family, contains REC and winged-helix (wHTH) domain [Pseudobacteriovorax antillogorgiicola]
MKGNPEDTYTITLDDDVMVHQIIEKSTKIKTIGIQDPQELLDRLEELQPVGIFIDIQLGSTKTGLDVLPNVRSHWPFCPILVITGTPTEQSISKALNSGADDFVRKPLIPDEVNARLKLRMADAAQKAAKEVVEFGDIVIDSAHRTVEGPSGKRFASPIEINLLATLANTEGSIVEKDALKMRCWGQIKVTDNALHRKLHAVRQLLRDVSTNVVIETKYGVGFALKYNPPLEAAS